MTQHEEREEERKEEKGEERREEGRQTGKKTAGTNLYDVLLHVGLVIANHFPWDLNDNTLVDVPTIQQLYDWGVDYVEVVNGDTFDLQSYFFAEKQNPKMGVITGTVLQAKNSLNFLFLCPTVFCWLSLFFSCPQQSLTH